MGRVRAAAIGCFLQGCVVAAAFFFGPTTAARAADEACEMSASCFDARLADRDGRAARVAQYRSARAQCDAQRVASR